METSNKVGRPEGGALTPCEDSRAQKAERLFLFPGKDSVNEKPQTLYYSPPTFLFLSIKVFSFPCRLCICTWLTMIVDSKLQFSADPE